RATLAHAPTAERALAALVSARNVCDWELSRQAETALETVRARQDWSAFTTITPFRLLMAANATPADQLAAARSFSSQYVTNELLPIMAPARPRSVHKRLRIGYFSGHFRDHPISHLLVGVIEAHDRAQFEIVAYDYSPPAKNDFRLRLEKAFDRVVSMHGLSYQQAGARIAQDC